MLNDILGQINDLMYTYLLLFLLLGTGLYFSIRSRFAQVRLMKEGFRILTEKAEVEDGKLSLIHITEPTRHGPTSRMPSSA